MKKVKIKHGNQIHEFKSFSEACRAYGINEQSERVKRKNRREIVINAKITAIFENK